jgi:hypothetical protein
MDLLSYATLFAVATTLVIAAVAKVISPREPERALRELDLLPEWVGPRLALVIAVGVPFAEWSLASTLVLAPSWKPALLLALVVFLTFAALGLRAVAGGYKVLCRCFGSMSSARFGWHQLVQTPVAVAFLAVLWVYPAELSMIERVGVLTIVHMVVALFALVTLFPSFLRIRRHRIDEVRVFVREGRIHRSLAG